MAHVFAKLAPNIRRHPKCREAGRDGTDVFIHALCVNAERGATGVVPAIYMKPSFIADELQMSEADAVSGLEAAVRTDLLEVLDDGNVLIVGWDEDEWGRARDSASMTEAERKRISREKKREELRAEASKRPDKSRRVRTVSGRPDYAESEEESDQSKSQKKSCGSAAPTAAVSDHRMVTDAFQAAYVAQTGSKPTWGAKQGKQVATLIAVHGRDETVARIGRLFGGSISSWCAPPYDLGTLVQHFDKLADVKSAPTRAGPAQRPLKGMSATLAASERFDRSLDE